MMAMMIMMNRLDCTHDLDDALATIFTISYIDVAKETRGL